MTSASYADTENSASQSGEEAGRNLGDHDGGCGEDKRGELHGVDKISNDLVGG